MGRIPLIGGAYSARWSGANAQRCVNYYPELNTQDAPCPVTSYQRPGLSVLAQGPVAPVRGLWVSSQGQGYACIGQNVYTVSPQWQLGLIGQLQVPSSNPVSAIDNGTQMLLVDGTELGYQILLSTNAFSTVVDPTGIFQGATRVDILDTFIVGNIPGTPDFFSTISNSLTFDALYFAAKSAYPDPLQTLIVNRRELLLLGAKKSEIWYDAGGATFPFAELPGAYIEHGAIAPYSVASSDIDVMWLAQDLQGRGIVFRQRGYETTRISNHALEVAIRKMAKAGTIADAIGWCWQQDGHVFYSLTFPTGDQTWVYDASMRDPNLAWHQEAWTDQNGQLHRHRANCFANMYSTNVCGDWQNGAIYAMDPDVYQDAGAPITFLRVFPQLTSAEDETGQIVPLEGKQVTVGAFGLDMQVGEGAAEPGGTAVSLNPAHIKMRYSNDRGKSWSTYLLQSDGAPGEYRTAPLWRQQGTGRWFIFEVSHSINGPAALNQAWVEALAADK